MSEFQITGLAHIGIPVKNADRSFAFYAKLGFEAVFRADPAETGFPVIFAEHRSGLVLELYELPEQACGKSGAVNHFAINTADIQSAYNTARSLGILPAGETIHSMPVFQNGVRFFMIDGPDGEKIEFNQKL